MASAEDVENTESNRPYRPYQHWTIREDVPSQPAAPGDGLTTELENSGSNIEPEPEPERPYRNWSIRQDIPYEPPTPSHTITVELIENEPLLEVQKVI